MLHLHILIHHWVDDVMGRNYDVITFFLNIFVLRRPRVTIFTDIIKIGTYLLKQPLRTQ